MNIFSKIKSFFKKPEFDETLSHLSLRSPSSEFAEASSHLAPSSSLTRSVKESFSLIFQDYLKIKSELEVSDVNVSGNGVNFKVNYRGSVVPFWLSPDLKLAETSSHLSPRSPSSPNSVIEDALAVIAVGLAIGLNLVEISQSLKNFRTSDIISKV